MADQDPREPSSDFQFMYPFWRMVKAIIGGAPAMRSAKGTNPLIAGPQAPVANLWQLDRSGRVGPLSPYLPKFLNETDIAYKLRRENAPLTNIYSDISRNLAARPFSKTCELDEKTPQDLKDLSDDIDGQGRNLHTFAREVFKATVDNGISWIMTDYTKVGPGATLADERGLGARPYWVHITADRLLAVYSSFLNGKEIISHARIDECYTRRDGYREVQVERVRVLNRETLEDEAGNIIAFGPASWELYESIQKDDLNNANQATSSAQWRLVDQGQITVGYIPLQPVIFGKRDGTSWKVDPPLKDLAYLQVEEFQQESNLKTIKELTAFPMLAGNGVQQPVDAQGAPVQIGVGPHVVLLSTPDANGGHGEWKFIEPSGSSLTFLQSDLEKLRTEMRDLGMQPLSTANLTVITTANVSMKAHSAIQAWALLLKDALEGAFLMTCDWLGQKNQQPVVNVHTDFGVDFEAGTELEALLKMQAQGALSKLTLQSEFKRRGVLSDDFDPEEEEKILAEEDQGLTPEVAIDPATGQLVYPTTRPKILTAQPTLPAGSKAAPPATQQKGLN